MSMTNFGEDLALKATCGVGTSAFTAYLALFTVTPGETGGGTEVSGGAYARVAITWGAVTPGEPSTKANSAPVAFPAATADWAAGATQVVAWAVFDALTVGNMIEFAPILAADLVTSLPRNVYNGDTVTFATGQLIARVS